MNIEEFKKWLLYRTNPKPVQNESTATKYINNLTTGTEHSTPDKLLELGVFDFTPNLFELNISELQQIKNQFDNTKSQLRLWSDSIGNGLPRAAFNNLFKFLEHKSETSNISDKKQEVDFSGLTRDDIIKGIEWYEKEQRLNNLSPHRMAQSYTLFFNDKEYPHKYIVGFAYSYKHKLEKPLSPDLYSATGTHKKSAQHILNKLGFTVMRTRNSSITNNSQTPENFSNNPLNQILFGPPGTGKTYHTINKAIEIIENRLVTNEENRAELKQKFAEYKAAGQIEFVTFHQSYGYEEFVEGIKAKTTETGISYSVEDGIFKSLSDKAKDNFIEYKAAENLNHANTFDTDKLIQDFAEYVQQQIEEKGSYHIRDEGNLNPIPILVNKNKNGEFQSFVTQGIVNGQSLSFKIIKRDIENFINGEIKDYRQISPSQNSSSQTHGNAMYYFPLYQKIESFLNIKGKQNYQQDKKNIELKNYILIIDEINRGNISKIFGELITLIEPSKRIGAEEEIRISLPYSSNELDAEPFGVPKNLYIIGTMNTADRSIAPIDTALRRRFEFEEMLPMPELLSTNIEGIDLQQVLKAINARIEYLYDRDHTIGHSYLMDVTDLASLRSAFKNKIIPLLAEYFYEDWENINLVLNKNEFIENNSSVNNYTESLSNQVQDKKIYRVSDYSDWQPWQFEKIYNDKAMDPAKKDVTADSTNAETKNAN